MNYNELSKAAHENAVKHGWWEKQLSNEHCLMLVITEISEAIEADRSGRNAQKSDYDFWQKEIPNDFVNDYETYIKNTKEDEMADIVIRLFDLAGRLGIDFDKMNACRYVRAFDHFGFTDNAFALCKGLCREIIGVEKRIQFGIEYVMRWAKALNIDLPFFIREKMRYNATRPYKHNKQY